MERGSVLSFDGMTRTGTLEGPGGREYFFTLFSSGVLLRPGDEVTFSGIVDGLRRVARDIRKVPRPAFAR